MLRAISNCRTYEPQSPIETLSTEPIIHQANSLLGKRYGEDTSSTWMAHQREILPVLEAPTAQHSTQAIDRPTPTLYRTLKVSKATTNVLRHRCSRKP